MAQLYPVAGAKISIGPAVTSVPDDDDLTAADFASVVWTEIKGWQTMGAIGDNATLISEDIISSGRTLKAKGTRNAGSMQNSFIIIPEDTGQLALLAAENSPYNFPFKIEFDDAPPTGTAPKPTTKYFYGIVMSSQEQGGGANTARRISGTVEINSAVITSQEEGIEFDLVDEMGKPIGLKWGIKGPDSKQARKAQRDVAAEFAKRAEERGNLLPPDDEDDERMAAFLAKVSTHWSPNPSIGGNEVPFSEENARNFLTRFRIFMEQLTAAAVKTEQSVESLEASAKGLGATLGQAGQGAQRATQPVQQFTRVIADQDEHVRAFRMELERLTAKFQPMAQASKNYEAAVSEINRAHQLGVINAQQMQKALDAERMAYERLRTAATGAGQAVQAANQNNASSAQRSAGINAGYQFQDIAVTAAMGMNPLMIGLQQGTQLASVVGSMERPVAGLAAAFTSLINPVSLVTIGLTAGVAALIQYFSTAEDGTDKTSKLFQEQNETIRKAAELWGEAVPSLKAYVDELDRADKITQGREAGEILAGRELEGLSDNLDAIKRQALEAFRSLQGDQNNVAIVRDLRTAWGDLRERLDDGSASMADLNRVQRELSNAVEKYGTPQVLAFRDAFDEQTAAIYRSIEAANKARTAYISALAGGTNVQDIVAGSTFTENGRIYRPSDFIPVNPPIPGGRPRIELEGLPGAGNETPTIINSDGRLVTVPIPGQKPNYFEREADLPQFSRANRNTYWSRDVLNEEAQRRELGSAIKGFFTDFGNALRSNGGDLGDALMESLSNAMMNAAQAAWDRLANQLSNALLNAIMGQPSVGLMNKSIGFSGANTTLGQILGAGGGVSANDNVAGGFSGLAAVGAVTRAPLGDIASFRDAIASIESRGSGDYSALGPVTRNGDRAYGRYQVMGNNIGPWSQAALGRSLSAEEFLANPSLQDQVFDHRFGSYVNKYGPSGAAQAWFGGPGSVGKGGAAADMLGTTGSEYVEKFNSALGGATENLTGFGQGLGQLGQSLSTSFFPAAPSAPSGGGAFSWLGGLFGGGGANLSKYVGLTGLFADGTNYAPGGLAIVGERGPELVNLPQGSQVTSNHKMADMMRGAGGDGSSVAPGQLNVNIMGANGDDHVRKLVQQGAITIDFSGGGVVTATYERCMIEADDTERHEVINWMGAYGNGGYRFFTVPIINDGIGPFPVINGRRRPIIKGIPHSDGSLFTDGSGYSQATVYGEITEAANVGAGIIRMRIYGAARDLRWSDWFSIYHPTKGWRAYRYWEVIDKTDEANPVYTLGIAPPLREAIIVGTRAARLRDERFYQQGYDLPFQRHLWEYAIRNTTAICPFARRDPIFTPIFTAVFGTATIGATSITVASVASAIATTALTIGLQAALAPKPPKPEKGKFPLQQAIPFRIWGVGRNRTAGAFMLWESSPSETALYAVQALRAHRIKSINRFWLHDDEVTRDADGYVVALGKRYASSSVRIQYRLGLPIETAYEMAVDMFGSLGLWTNNHRGDGQASTFLWASAAKAKDQAKRFPYGIPMLSVESDDAACWDPRDPDQDPEDPDTWTWTQNTALHIIWWLCFSEFGFRLDYNKAILPVLDMWIEEADICDEDIPNAGGGTHKRYQSNLWDTTENDPKAALNALLAACDGHLVNRGDGARILTVGKFRESRCATLTDRDIIGHRIDYDVLPEDEINRLVPTFTYAETGYTTTDTDYFEDTDAQLKAGRVLATDMDLVAVQDWRQARFVAIREWRRLRQKVRGQLDVRLSGINSIYARWVRMETPIRLPRLNGKLVENRRSILAITKGGFTMDIVQHPSNIDAWNPSTDEGQQPPVPPKPNYEDVLTPVINLVQAKPNGQSVHLRVVIIDPEESSYTPVVHYRLVNRGDGQPGAWVSQEFPDAVPSGGFIDLNTNVVPSDKLLDVQVAFKDSSGDYGNWSTTASVTSTVYPDPPQDVTDVSAINSATAGQVVFQWTAPNDSSYQGGKAYWNTTNSFAGATLFGEKLSGPGITNNYRLTGLSAGTRYGWVVAVNKSGVPGNPVETGPFTVI
eukprot:g7585.t1